MIGTGGCEDSYIQVSSDQYLSTTSPPSKLHQCLSVLLTNIIAAYIM